MASTTRFTYNITSQNNDLDRNNSYYTYNNYNNYDNINNNNIIYSQSQNHNNSFLNQTTPLIYNENNSNLNNISYNVNRFSRLHSRLDEINEKINRDKDEKENYVHNKITTTEMILDNNNEIKARKIKEIKTSIRSLSALFEQIKNFSKENNSQSKEILENFENKFNLRLKQEQDKRINLEKRLKGVIDSKFRDMKSKIIDSSKERMDDFENLKNKMEEIVPQLKMKVDESKKIRKLKDDEIKDKIKNKMNYYNDIMKKEIKKREDFDEKSLDDIKYSFADFNKQMRQNTFNREQSQGKLIDLVDATITQFEARGNNSEI